MRLVRTRSSLRNPRIIGQFSSNFNSTRRVLLSMTLVYQIDGFAPKNLDLGHKNTTSDKMFYTVWSRIQELLPALMMTNNHLQALSAAEGEHELTKSPDAPQNQFRHLLLCCRYFFIVLKALSGFHLMTMGAIMGWNFHIPIMRSHKSYSGLSSRSCKNQTRQSKLLTS